MKKMFAFLCVILAVCLCLVGCKSDDYALAVLLQDAGAYTEAAEIYATLVDYEDAADRLIVCQTAISQEEAFAQVEAEYDAAARSLIQKNEVLKEAIASAEAVLGSGIPLDASRAIALEQSINQAKDMLVAPVYSPREMDSMIAVTNEMNAIDYQVITEELDERSVKLEESIIQCRLVNNPSEEYIVACLENIPGVTGIAPATEQNDPNGKLNKDGGYTAAVFFAHENINTTPYSGNTLLNKGTSAGGCLEVYCTVEDAQARNTYLAGFDGTFLDSGSHTVLGTVVIRVSPNMTATEQDAVEAAIISVLLQEQ